MFRRIAAITFIFVCTTIAWAILGSTIFARTYERGPALRQKVVSNWGGPHQQRPATASYPVVETETTEATVDGKVERRATEKTVWRDAPLESSRVRADLRLEHRQKGLLWYSTYVVSFAGRYVFRNPKPDEAQITFAFPFPSEHAIYDDLTFQVDGNPVPVTAVTKEARGTARVAGNAVAVLAVSYRSQGLDTWQYDFGGDVAQVRDFELRARTDFDDVDFPEGTLSPTTKQRAGGGWDLAWSYKNLMTGQDIGIAAPERLQPGPLAGQISFFAPVSLLFFFFVLFIVTVLRSIDLHPMNYFFLAAAFFAFHLLLAYLVDHVPVHIAFVAASAVSVALVVSYLRLVTGFRFAAAVAGSAQLVYLVLFSYAFFFKGFTGLAITAGSILTLFVAMQLTGRVRWGERSSA
jgi:hypothetical protein